MITLRTPVLNTDPCVSYLEIRKVTVYGAVKKPHQSMGFWLPQVVFLFTLVYTGRAYTCLYFYSHDFSHQTLVILREREDYCVLDKTTTDGDTVVCKGNTTATRVNSTHVLLSTDQEPDVNFFLNYGRDGEPGKNADYYKGACPPPPARLLQGSQRNTTDHAQPNRRYVSWWSLLMVPIVIPIVIIFIYMKNKKDKPADDSTEGSLISQGSIVKDVKVLA
ncbi:hypothetical protein GDO81_014671 [Engystomops pustulosus]|uniref:Uncharacterized protein n=1 Tax=Engystomops pustulosus TaxID=76066 RepID=A0AAV7BBY5_ENGPU|nr:hypothetical protein GDO81_014671 [Engystomops pustulosus]